MANVGHGAIFFPGGNIVSRKTTHVLLVDNSATYAAQLRNAFEVQSEYTEIAAVQSLAEARHCLSSTSPDLVITEWLLPDGKGIDLLPCREDDAPCPIIIVTGCGNERAAVEAMKAGALDYVVKSDSLLTEMPHIVTRVLDEWAEIVKRVKSEKSCNCGTKINHNGERFRTFFESAAAGMVTLSPEGQFLTANDAFCSYIGYSRNELSSLCVSDITHSEDLAITAETYQRLGGGECRSISYRKRFSRKDGGIIWGHVSVASVLGEDKIPEYFVGLVQDITEYIEVQDQIRESKQMLQLVLDNIPQYVFWKDRNSVYLGCNRNFARGAGVGEPQNLVGKSDYDLPWTEAEAEFYRDCDLRVMEEDKPQLHILETQLQADGRQAWLDTNKIPLHDGDGRVAGILGTFEDITERKRAEDELVEANRELDAFVSTVSHDLRTPLTPIISYAEVLQEAYRDQLDGQALDYLAKIEGQGRRMLAVMEDLLVLARVGHVKRPAEPVDPNTVLEDVLIAVGSQMAEAGIVTEKTPLPLVQVPVTLLVQIFDNLIGNAIRYAGKEGSPIEIGGERKGNLVQLFVRDHGPGIPEEERRQIFELFYRGVASGKSSGTGVGLATVQKISRLFGGRAWVEETFGGGSTFIVELADC